MGKGLTITAFVLSFVFPIVGLILGIIAYKDAKEDPEALKGLAIASIIVGSIFTLLGVIVALTIGMAWFTINKTIEEGYEKIDVSTQCTRLNLRMVLIDADSDRIVVSRGPGEANLNQLKVFINSEFLKDVNARVLNAGGTLEINAQIDSGDQIRITPVIGPNTCPNVLTRYVN